MCFFQPELRRIMRVCCVRSLCSFRVPLSPPDLFLLLLLSIAFLLFRAVLSSWFGGLPMDITIEEVREHFNKCGIIATDPLTQQPKIKIYK